VRSLMPPSKTLPDLKGLIVPHAGYAYSGGVAGKAYSAVPSTFKRVIAIGPSHFFPVTSVTGDEEDAWETPLGVVRLGEHPFPSLRAAHLFEHSLEVQLPFLQEKLKRFEFVPLVVNEEFTREEVEMLSKALGEGDLLIVSSDLSHYHSYDEAVRLDKATVKALESLDEEALLRCEACGLAALRIAVRLAKEMGWGCKLLEYKNSGDVTKDFERVVGYASLAFTER